MIGRRLLPAAALAGCGTPGGPGQAQPGVAGETALSNTPALASHKTGAAADNPDLILRWNRLAPPVDLVLHFHGFAADARGLDLRLAMGGSGLDLAPVPEARASGPLLTRPTLALLPRGRPRGATGGAFDWPALSAPGGLAAVLSAGLAAVGRPAPGRITLTAHSGGGGGLLATLDQAARDNIRIHRVILYDALYREPSALLRWVRLVPDASLTLVYGPGSSNERNARAVAAAYPATRLIASQVSHGDQPRFYGWRLLAEG